MTWIRTVDAAYPWAGFPLQLHWWQIWLNEALKIGRAELVRRTIGIFFGLFALSRSGKTGLEGSTPPDEIEGHGWVCFDCHFSTSLKDLLFLTLVRCCTDSPSRPIKVIA